MKHAYTLKGKLFKWSGASAAWYFIALPKKESREIREGTKGKLKGFGSIPVSVTVGKTSWRTSVFPTKQGPYILPVKAQVRKSEDLAEEDIVTFSIRF
jgi:hypothetical protein